MFSPFSPHIVCHISILFARNNPRSSYSTICNRDLNIEPAIRNSRVTRRQTREAGQSFNEIHVGDRLVPAELYRPRGMNGRKPIENDGRDLHDTFVRRRI